ncbi:MAG: aminoacetone oxidase family FAD-binding enzyme [Clostridia bacterium]|nr:aminoacetone oxidase family FAD-binding enzyme [Clostridia bacterium]
MDKFKVIIIGGGASGMWLAAMLGKKLGGEVAILERNDRVGKKLLATGNGQGNVGNKNFSLSCYRGDGSLISSVFQNAPQDKILAQMQGLGILTSADERGRIYPLSRQASSVLEMLRTAYLSQGVKEIVNAEVSSICKVAGGYVLQTKVGEFFARNVVFATGGKSGNGFGTDGSAYELMRSLGHSVTALMPSLVALKADTAYLKNLKGVRIDARLCCLQKPNISERGDVLFTDSGISGDAAFRLSARLSQNFPCECKIDFLPDFTQEALEEQLVKKARTQRFTALELLVSVVHKQLAKNILRMINVGENAPSNAFVAQKCAYVIKNFALTVVGTAGFGVSQVTKGGIPAAEVCLSLESKLATGVYLCGELLDVDGDCGGYNLQWAFASATVVAQSLLQRKQK